MTHQYRQYNRIQKPAEKRVVTHFQEKLQKRLCCEGRSENVTLVISEVNCGNCIEKLKKRNRPAVDWDAAKTFLKRHLAGVEKQLLEFTIC